MRRTSALSSMVLAVLCVAALTSCTATAAAGGGDGSPSPSRSATRTPSANPTASGASDLLFTITADLVSPDGQHVDVQETAHAPVTDDEEARKVLTAGDCADDLAAIGTPHFVKVEMAATMAGGGAEPDGSVLYVPAGSIGSAAPIHLVGDWNAQARCSDGILSVPGSASGYVAYPDADGWISGRWGAGATTTAADGSSTDFTVASCHVELGAAAASARLPDGWTDRRSGPGCIVGAES